MRNQLVVGILAGFGFAVLLGLAAVAGAPAAAQDCEPGPYCVGIPGVRYLSTGNTPTPTIAVTPFVEPPCDTVPVPTPAEGLQAWVVPPTTSYARVCTRLFVNSRSIRGLPVEVHVHDTDGDMVVYPRKYGEPESYQASIIISPYLTGRLADVIVNYSGVVYRTGVEIPLAVGPTATPEPTP
ncbi:MAG TPA: hypothetical protein VFS21_33230 [Roseiflexaceae bacterium]|nr:hypothetical protein [Roseiflexaceae bacterium]